MYLIYLLILFINYDNIIIIFEFIYLYEAYSSP